MKITVSKTDTFDVRVYAYSVDGEIGATHDKSDLPENVDETEEVKFVFRRPSNFDSNTILKESRVNGPDESNLKLDISLLQDAILRKLLVDWDVKDDNNEKLRLTQGNINILHPDIARAAASGCMDKVKL